MTKPTENPLVSVIMPSYNAEKHIALAMASVQKQTFSQWELLVVDDCSTDGTLDVVSAFAKADSRIIPIPLDQNSGAGVARNTGIKVAKGRYIAFLDADDLWLPDKLETQLDFMQRNGYEMAFSSYKLMAEDGQTLNKVVQALPVLTYGKLLKSNYVGNLTGIYDTQNIGKRYAPAMRKRQDWALWLDILKAVGKAGGIQEPLARYRMGGDSLSANKFGMLEYNYAVYRKHLAYSPFKSIWRMGIFLWEHFMVKPKQTKAFTSMP